MNIDKNKTVTVNCQPELGQGIVRDIFQIEGGPTTIIVSFGDQGKIDYFFPCELTVVENTQPSNEFVVEICPKCKIVGCSCSETKVEQSLKELKEDVDRLFLLRLKDLLQIPTQRLTPAQGSLILQMYKDTGC